MKSGWNRQKAHELLLATPRERWLRRGLFGFVFLLAALTLWFSVADPTEPKVLSAGSDLSVPIAKLSSGKIRLFTFDRGPSGTTTIAVERGKDNAVRVAFAMCRNCSKFRHYLWFGKLICAHCGHSLGLPDPNEDAAQKKGCYLVAVPHAIEGDNLIVRWDGIVREFERWYQTAR